MIRLNGNGCTQKIRFTAGAQEKCGAACGACYDCARHSLLIAFPQLVTLALKLARSSALSKFFPALLPLLLVRFYRVLPDTVHPSLGGGGSAVVVHVFGVVVKCLKWFSKPLIPVQFRVGVPARKR